jgi:LmbE family N-acetylglucosaminyl deacetylase
MLRVLVIGAHPDDCEFAAGGTAALWARRGDRVRFLSMTNGDAGHFAMEPAALAARRRLEAERAAAVIGVESQVLAHCDGRLEPSLENRLDLIGRIRSFAPDLILTHRPSDYHPDHRYTSILVQDSAYVVTVPLIRPDVRHLDRNPVIAYVADRFRKPLPFSADVAVDVGPVMDLKWAMLQAHASQFYEWLPYNDGSTAQVPAGDAERRRWLEARWGPLLEEAAAAFRTKLAELYSEEDAARVRFAEAFEIGEHGRQPSAEELRRLFPLE